VSLISLYLPVLFETGHLVIGSGFKEKTRAENHDSQDIENSQRQGWRSIPQATSTMELSF